MTDPTPQDDTDVTFSFIVPVRDEQERLERFHGALADVAGRLGETYEIVFVNDGSTDSTEHILRRMAQADPCVKVVEFSRDFGHDAAVKAGYDFARGRAVISIDPRRNHPVELIPELVACWREGFEVVYPVDGPRRSEPKWRRGLRERLEDMVGLFTGWRRGDHADFRLLDQAAVRALRATREHTRSLRGLVHWIGFRQTTILFPPEAVDTAARRSRRGGWLGLVLPIRPMQIVAACGTLLLLVAVLYALTTLVLWPIGAAPGGIFHLAMAVVALLGLQLVIFGLLGEYVPRIFQEARGRPLYVVRQTLGFLGPGVSAPAPQAAPAPAKTEYGGFSVYT